MQRYLAGAQMSEADWFDLIRNATSAASLSSRAIKYRHTFPPYQEGGKGKNLTAPVWFECGDGIDRVVKPIHRAKRTSVSEQIVGRLGNALQAPVPPVALVEVTVSHPQLSEWRPGLLHHSSAYVGEVKESYQIMYQGEGDNRSRFLHLAILAGWTGAGDLQFFYDRSHRLFSFDHGNFLDDHWHERWCRGEMEPIEIDKRIRCACQFTNAEMKRALEIVEGITDEIIAQCVASPPMSWEEEKAIGRWERHKPGLEMKDRVQTALFLSLWRDRFLSLVG
jgi:hypothetical protein